MPLTTFENSVKLTSQLKILFIIMKIVSTGRGGGGEAEESGNL